MSQSIAPARRKLFHRPWKADQGSQKQILSDIVSGLKTVAGIVNQVTNAVDIGPPGLKTGLTGLIYVLDAIQVSDRAHWGMLFDKHLL